MARALPLLLALAACTTEPTPTLDAAVYDYGTDLKLRDALIRQGRMVDDLGGALIGHADPSLAQVLGVEMTDVPDPTASETLWVVAGHRDDPEAVRLVNAGRSLWSGLDGIALYAIDAELPEPGFRCHGAVRKVRSASLRPTTSQAQRVGVTAVDPAIATMTTNVDLARMQADVDALVAFGSRRHGQAGEFATQTLLEQRFAALGLDVETTDYDSGADTVCGVLPGVTAPEQIVIVGAHFDSVNWQSGSASPAPGADDDASGVAAVLEIARVLTQQPGFDRTMRFCGWSGEELGLLGSDAEAARLAAANADVVGMIQLDMIGYTPSGQPREIEFILNDTTASLNAFTRDVFATYVPSLPTTEGFLGAGSSDHASFFAYGFPTTWPFEDSGNGSPFIHTSSDTVGTSINDWVKARLMTQGTLAAMAELARPLSVRLDHDALPDTTDDVGPLTVTVEAVPQTADPVDRVDLRWRLEGEQTWTTVAMTPVPGTDDWTAQLPPQSSPARVTYVFDATDTAGRSATLPEAIGEDVFRFTVGARTTVFFDDFEGPTDNGWTHVQLATQDDWQRGVPQGKSTDPLGAFSGSAAWANDLGPSGFDGAYQPNVDNYLESPAIDTTGQTDLRLRYARWLNVEKGQYDQATLEIDGGTVWENPFATDLLDRSWVIEDLDVSARADDRAALRLRWTLTSDGGLEFGGWNIDDVELYSLRGSSSLGGLRLLGPATARVGDEVTLRLVGLPSRARWTLVVSGSNAGTTVMGQPLEVGRNYEIVGSGRADTSGSGSFTFRVPSVAAGGTWYLEAGAIDGTLISTNLHTLVVE